MGCHALLQGMFLTQGSNLSLMSSALESGFFTSSATWEALPSEYLLEFKFSLSRLIVVKFNAYLNYLEGLLNDTVWGTHFEFSI